MVYESRNKLSFLIVQSVLVAVSSSYYQKEISGYLFTTSSYNGEWRNQYDAQNWCNQNGSKLLAITNASVQNAVVAFINDAIQQNQLSGNLIITDGKRTTDDWRWINGTSLPTLRLSIEGQTRDGLGLALSYVYLYRTSDGFNLYAAQPTDKNYYICEFSGQTSCVNGYQNQNQCFQSVDDEYVTWFEARNRCLLRGGDLATFEFITTNDDLNILNGSWINQLNRYWIGLRRQLWTWQSIDSDVTYSQWSSGHPVYDFYKECLCLLPNNPTYDWKWSECYCILTYQFVCIRASPSSSVSLASTSTKISIDNPSSSTSYDPKIQSLSQSTINPQFSNLTENAFHQNNCNSSKDSSALIVGLCIGVPALLTILILGVLLIRQNRIIRKYESSSGTVTGESANASYETLQTTGSTELREPNGGSTYQELTVTRPSVDTKT